MTNYVWPAYKAQQFELRVMPNLRAYVGSTSPTTDVLDLLGEVWIARVAMAPEEDPVQAAGREAFFDRLKGPANTLELWHLKVQQPNGTMRGSTTILTSVPQLSDTATLTGATAAAGLPTLRAGDMLGLGGQLVRVMADATANGAGHITFEFMPRARQIIAAGAAVNWNRPTALFRLKSDGVPTVWNVRHADGADFELIEAI